MDETGLRNVASFRLLIVSQQSTGGAVESLIQLVSGLPKEQVEVVVWFTADAPDSTLERVRRCGAEVIGHSGDQTVKHVTDILRGAKKGMQVRIRRRLGVIAERLYVEFRSLYLFVRYTIPNIRSCRQVMRNVAPSVVHLNHGGVRGHAVVLAASGEGLPCVVHMRAKTSLRLVDKLVARRVAHFVYISRYIRDEMVAQCEAMRNGSTVYNALKINQDADDADTALRTELGLPADTYLVGLVGRIDHWKGHDVFVRSIDLLKDRQSSVVGVIVGGRACGELAERFYSRVSEEVRQKDLADRILFLGHRADIRQIMHQLDVLTLTSTTPEPFGRVIIEGMASRTPVIATAAGGPLEIIEHGKTGLLVPPGDPVALADSIEQLIQDRAGADAIADSAYRHVREKFSIESHVTAMQKIYNNVRYVVPKSPVKA